MGYQLKLDFGEGRECHEAYEEYLKQFEQEDTPETWAIFVRCWQLSEIFNGMDEASRSTLQ